MTDPVLDESIDMISRTIDRAIKEIMTLRDRTRKAEAELAKTQKLMAMLDAELAQTRRAMTPSGETKSAYLGEFYFNFPTWDKDGHEVTRSINVPWVTIKEIMVAISARAKGGPK